MKPGQVYAEFRMRDGRVATLRALRKDDLAAAVRFVNSLVKEKKRNPTLGVVLDRLKTRRTEKEYLDRLLERLAKGDAVSVVAEVGGEIVGNSEIFRRYPSKELSHTGTLGIAILDGYRGLGLGKAMMQLLLARAKKAGIYIVELEVFAINGGAKHLYEVLGFETVGVVPDKVKRNGRYFDLVVMYADLRKN